MDHLMLMLPRQALPLPPCPRCREPARESAATGIPQDPYCGATCAEEDAASADLFIRCRGLSSLFVSVATLARNEKDELPGVRGCIVANLNTPPELVRVIAERAKAEEWPVWLALAGRPEHDLQRLAFREGGTGAHITLVNNPRCPEDILVALANLPERATLPLVPKLDLNAEVRNIAARKLPTESRPAVSGQGSGK